LNTNPQFLLYKWDTLTTLIIVNTFLSTLLILVTLYRLWRWPNALALPHMLPTHFPTFQEGSPHVFLPSKSVPHMFSYLSRVFPTCFPTFQECSPHVFLPSKSVPHTFSCLPRVFPKFIVNKWMRVGRIRCSSSLVRKRSLWARMSQTLPTP